MEGAHKRQRQIADTIHGDKEEAAAKRRRAQSGVAAAGRHGQSIQAAKAARARKGGLDLELLKKDAEEALKAGAGLVQASLEHLEEGERSWDKFVEETGMVGEHWPKS